MLYTLLLQIMSGPWSHLVAVAKGLLYRINAKIQMNDCTINNLKTSNEIKHEGEYNNT